MSTMKTTTDILNGRTRRPTHPGEILREDVLPALAITQTQFAKILGVSRRTLNEVLNEKRPVTIDVAIRLGQVLGNGHNLWLKMQLAVDVWDTLEKHKDDYQHLQPLSKIKAA
jgi:antitoxin HigA-1